MNHELCSSNLFSALSLDRLSLGEEIGFRKQGEGFATKAIHTGQKPEQWNSR